MRLLIWGGWQASLLEGVVRALRGRVRESQIFVQVVADAKAIDFCNVKPGEFVRAAACDVEALRRSVTTLSKQGPVVVLLDGWGLLREEGLLPFLEQIEAQRWSAVRFVLTGPANWRRLTTHANCLPKHAAPRDVQRQALFLRTQRLMEFALNLSTIISFVQSPPPAELVAASCGVSALVPVRKWGFWLAPKLLLSRPANFVSRERLLASILPALLGEGRRLTENWFEEVRGDKPTRSLRQTWRESSEGAKAAGPGSLLLQSCSWNTYVAASGLLPVVCAEQNGLVVSPGMWAEWIYSLAVLEEQHEPLTRLIESGMAEIFDRPPRPRST
jgi:hypothetical protein